MEYQGYVGTSGAYRRSDGLQPEPGWIMIPLEDLGKIEIHPRSIPWRAVAGVEFDGGVDIRTWDRFRRQTTITADRAPSPEPESGLNMSGDLILRTYEGLNDGFSPGTRYYDIYVDFGMEEETRDLESILEHKEGLVRVPLTDIRKFYGEYGAVFCRINCRRKNGEWDKDTLKEDGETPWSLLDVFSFLFSQLPGSPQIVEKCDLRSKSGFDAPQGIEGQGEPAVQIIEQLLRKTGLKAQMQPSGWYAINRVNSNRIPRQTIATAPRTTKTVKSNELQYERLTSTPTNRAPAFTCVGPRRVQRRSWPCTAVLRDPETGKWHTLAKICRLWGYSIEKLNRMVFVSGPRQYEDVPPAPTVGGTVTYATAQLHAVRKEALRMAYRQYIPSFMIDKDGDVIDPEKEMIPYLPVLPETAWYKNELSQEQMRDYPKDKATKGDLDEIIMYPPVVRANLVSERYFNRFDEIEREIESVLVRQEAVISGLEALRDFADTIGDRKLEDLLQSEKVSDKTIKDMAKYGVDKSDLTLNVGGDLAAAAKELGTVMPKDVRIAYTKNSDAAAQSVILYANMKREAESAIAEQKTVAAKIRGRLAEEKAKYELNGRIHGRYNVGQGPTLKAHVVDFETGLIESSVPLCVIDRPWFFNGDDVSVIADGSVVVTYGYEIKGSGSYAFTNYMFFADDGGDPTADAKPAFGGCHRSSPIKALVMPMESREYIAENGNPMNYSACFSEAKGKVAERCSGPAVIPGWVMEIHGLRPCVLDGGIMSVQHEWDGDVGITHVSVNAPGARMPLMAPIARPPRQVAAAQLRDMLQREG